MGIDLDFDQSLGECQIFTFEPVCIHSGHQNAGAENLHAVGRPCPGQVERFEGMRKGQGRSSS
jgi:hypothetical protein